MKILLKTPRLHYIGMDVLSSSLIDNTFLQNLGWFVQMKYRFSERRQSQPSTYLFHTLDVHVKLYSVNFFFIRWNWEFQPWILLLLSQRQWLWSAFFLFMFFPDRIPRKVPSIITLIDIWQRDKWLDWNQAAGWLHKWIEIKLANGRGTGLKSKWKMDMWSDLNQAYMF